MTRPHEPPRGVPDGPRLCDADMRVLDFLAEHGFDVSRVDLLPEADRPRALALIRQMSVLDQYPADGCEDALVDATLARIDRYEAAREASMRLDARRTVRGFRLADFVSVAALVLVGIGVLLPVASRMREQSLATVCASNLRGLHSGLDAYARNHGGALPATASIGGLGSLFSPVPSRPGRVGPAVGAPPQLPAPYGAMRPAVLTHTVIFPGATVTIVQGVRDWSASNHSAHLGLLVAGQYADVHALQCPGCASGVPCFAYRVPARGHRFMLDTPGRTVVVADANPVIEFVRMGITPDSRVVSSRNHSDRGQNLLFNDGAVEWRVSPLLTTSPASFVDNIWLPRDERGRESLDLRAWPCDVNDNFVAQ